MGPMEAAWVSLVGAAIVLAAVAGVRLSARIGMPSLLIYLAIGLALSDDALGWIHFDNAELATSLGFAGLVVILTEGGLTTRPSSVRPVLAPATLLASVGVAISIALVALPLHVLTGLDLHTAVLIGTVLAPTDAAAVFTVARGLRLPTRLQTLLEAESGFNDAPVAVIVVILATSTSVDGPIALIPLVVIAELIGGIVIGVAVGLAARWMLPRLALPATGLYPVAVIALVMFGYGLAVVLHTSGFAAVYVIALIMAGAELPHRRSVIGFVEGLAWAVQIGLFIMLGLLTVPSRLPAALGMALLAGALLLFVARPISVLACMAPFIRPGWLARITRTSPMPLSWTVFTSWAGLRGAVPIIFATIPLAHSGTSGELVFDVTLILVFLLTLAQAPTMPILARRLGIVRPERMGELSVEAAPLDSMSAALLDLDVPVGSSLAGTYVSEVPLPRDAVVSLVVRDGRTMVPDQHTRIRTGDRLLIVTTDAARPGAERALGSVSRFGRLAGWLEPRRRD